MNTFYVSLAVLILACLYAFAYSGLTGLLFTSAVAMIAHSFLNSFELVVAMTALFALLYTLILKQYLREPFVGDTATSVAKRLEDIQHKGKPKAEPFGLYPASLEGFEDLHPHEEKEGAASSSTAAPTAAMASPAVNSEKVAEVTKAVKDAKVAKEEFDSATGTLFKQGQMPSEHADGPKLDASATIKTAMESFDTDAVSNMTADTKDLINTQKKLMDMLVQMRPVLSDGKELLQTFSGMFGGVGSKAGGGSGMPFALK